MLTGGSKAGREGGCLVGRQLSDLGGPLPLPLPHLVGSWHTRPAQAVAKVQRVGRSRSRDSAFERVDCCQAQNSYVIKFQIFNSGINYFNRNALFKSMRSSPNSPPAKMVFFVLVSSVRSSYSHPDLLLTHQPLFQITPVLNTGLSLSEPLQLYKGYNAI